MIINRVRAEMAVSYGILHGKSPDQIVDMLDTDGLLMPDLPEKEQDGRWKVSCKHLPISHTSAAGNQVTLRASYGWWHTDWGEARSLGLCLLAAADYAERNQE